MDIRVVVGRNVRRLRVRRGISQELLAVDATMDRAHVSRIERGVENPTIQVVDRLAAALETDIRELFRPPSRGEPAPQVLRKGRRPKGG